MDIKDLMVGDFVHSKLHDVDSFVIDIEGRDLKAVSVWLDSRQCWERHYLDEIEPIPLTPAFFEKNGFKKMDSQTYRWEYAEGIYVQADFNGSEPFVYVSNRSAFACPVCRYVHELQHALNICGIEMNLKL